MREEGERMREEGERTRDNAGGRAVKGEKMSEKEDGGERNLKGKGKRTS